MDCQGDRLCILLTFVSPSSAFLPAGFTGCPSVQRALWSTQTSVTNGWQAARHSGVSTGNVPTARTGTLPSGEGRRSTSSAAMFVSRKRNASVFRQPYSRVYRTSLALLRHPRKTYTRSRITVSRPIGFHRSTTLLTTVLTTLAGAKVRFTYYLLFADYMHSIDLLSPGISPSRPSRTAYMHEDEHMEPSDGDMDLQDVFDPYTFPLQRGETLVVPHAHAGIAPYTIPTTSSSSSSGTHPTAGVRQQFPPWHPFPSLVDFEQTEHFVERNTPDPAVNKQLEISRKGANSSKMTIQNARDMHMVLEEAIEFDDLGEVSNCSTSN